VHIKLLKEFFLNPKPDDWVRRLRDLTSLPKYDDGDYIVFIEEMPLLIAS